MTSTTITFQEVLDEFCEDPEFAKGYEALGPKYDRLAARLERKAARRRHKNAKLSRIKSK